MKPLVPLAALAILCCPCSRPAQQTVIDPAAYPSMGAIELGHLKWMQRLAAQDALDFTNFEARSQTDLTAYRYQIAFGVYFLAVVQYHKVPAWPGLIQPAMDGLITKLLSRPVWEYWAQTSRGVPALEPGYDRPYQESHDPVGEKNIMYSGHVGHTVNLYQMLYRDLKWDGAGSMAFEWNDSEKYVYDNGALMAAMNRQMAENAHHSVSCEPNAVFPECNQHPVLAFLLYDRLHGTKLMEAGDRFFDFFKSSGMIDSETHEVSMLYLVKQGWTLSQQNPRYGNKLDPGMEIAVKSGAATLESATADGWTGLFMHAWQPSYIEEHYPYWKKNRLARTSDGYPGLKWESWEPWVQYGFFAALAAEMGDADTRDKMLRYADAHYAPVWVDGAYHYPFSEEAGCTNLTDRLLAIARTLPANGMRAMHASPFDDEHFTEPYAESAGSSLFFRRAIYDRGKKALVLSTESASPETASSFVVRRLDKNRKYRLTIDGKETARFNGRTERPVSADFSVPHDFILYED